MIVIPMAGLSSRFKSEGFNLPKYMLEAKGKTLFEHSMLSFKNYFDVEFFLFIALDVNETKLFIEAKCQRLGIKRFQIVILDAPTRGQAETVYLGLKAAKIAADTPITIFNIDTFRPGFTYPETFNKDKIDGYLETFIGAGKNWSNVLPFSEDSDKVACTAEKQEVSQYCCTGLYYFKTSESFNAVFEQDMQQDPTQMQGGEFYIAPMYNTLIAQGLDVRFSIIDSSDVIFCGVPDEYFAFLKRD